MRPQISYKTAERLDGRVKEIDNLKPEYLTTGQKIEAILDELERLQSESDRSPESESTFP